MANQHQKNGREAFLGWSVCLACVPCPVYCTSSNPPQNDPSMSVLDTLGGNVRKGLGYTRPLVQIRGHMHHTPTHTKRNRLRFGVSVFGASDSPRKVWGACLQPRKSEPGEKNPLRSHRRFTQKRPKRPTEIQSKVSLRSARSLQVMLIHTLSSTTAVDGVYPTRRSQDSPLIYSTSSIGRQP